MKDVLRLKRAERSFEQFGQFAGLVPATYSVEEEPPVGYLPGKDSVGSAGGTLAPPTGIANISLLSGTAGTDYDFGHLLPGSVSGVVYVDTNGDHTRDGAEPVLSGATIQLLNASNQVIAAAAIHMRSGRSKRSRSIGLMRW